MLITCCLINQPTHTGSDVELLPAQDKKLFMFCIGNVLFGVGGDLEKAKMVLE